MILFSWLNKQEKALWLPKLFDLLYDNMSTIAPSGLTYEQEKEQWLANVDPALDKAPRQIILCFVNHDLAGYIQYYTQEKLLMIEEMQLKKAYQRTFVFYRFCKHLMACLPSDIEYIEAYAEKRNRNSQKIMQKLGMVPVAEEENSAFVHLCGAAGIAKKLFR
ncbi:MAG: hypothetical protein IJ422_05030 [Oscillospiraceae bacterium]|nr:hypothetical protein [Oscillospiraceae bacterium]